MASAPTTPYLRVDLDRLRRNVRSTAEWATMHRLALRPHVKTHKSPEIARLQLGQGAVGLTVATLGEAEVFSQHGCTDLFVAYPVHVEERAAERLRSLAQRGRVAIGVDSVEAAARTGRHLAPYGVEVVAPGHQHHVLAGLVEQPAQHSADRAGAVHDPSHAPSLACVNQG